MNYGYVRTSRGGPDGDNQSHVLEEAGVEVVYKDLGVTGDSPANSREGWSALIKKMQSGDALYVVAIDRLSRRWNDCLPIITELRNNGIGFRSLSDKEAWTEYLALPLEDPRSFVGHLLVMVFGWIASMELESMRRRVKAGMEKAASEGRHAGRPRTSTPELRTLAENMFRSGSSISKIAKSLQRPRSTIQGWLREAGIR